MEVLLLDSEVVVFRAGIDCKFFISGPVEEVRLSSVVIVNIYNKQQRTDSKTTIERVDSHGRVGRGIRHRHHPHERTGK